MNKLRELIKELNKRQIIANWRERAIHRDNLEDYLMDNAESIADLIDAARPFSKLVIDSNGRIPVDKLSLSDWHEITNAYIKLEETK